MSLDAIGWFMVLCFCRVKTAKSLLNSKHCSLPAIYFLYKQTTTPVLNKVRLPSEQKTQNSPASFLHHRLIDLRLLGNSLVHPAFDAVYISIEDFDKWILCSITIKH